MSSVENRTTARSYCCWWKCREASVRVVSRIFEQTKKEIQAYADCNTCTPTMSYVVARRHVACCMRKDRLIYRFVNVRHLCLGMWGSGGLNQPAMTCPTRFTDHARQSTLPVHITSLITLALFLVVDSLLHCVSKKNDNDVAHYNFNAHKPILVIFFRDDAEWVCY